MADLHDVNWDTWLLLGEASSKIDHLSRIPLKQATADLLHTIYLAKGALASSAIEGNTLSEEEAVAIVEGKSAVPPSKEHLEREVQNIIEVCNWVVDRLDTFDSQLTADLIKDFNGRVLRGLELEPGVVPGEYREQPVAVGNVYRGAPAEDCEYLIERLCEWLNRDEFRPDDPAKRIVFAIVRAVFAHVYIAWIHPFGDGNGRTARLIEFFILVTSGAPSPAAHLLSNHYNETRSEYYRQLAGASRSGGDLMPFLAYGAQGLVDQLRQQLGVIYAQVLGDAWQNLVHETIPGTSEANRRRRHIAIDLAQRGSPVAREELAILTPRVAAGYARKSAKTLSRDVNQLIELGLMVRDGQGYRANTEVLLSFLPRKVLPT